MATAAVLGLSAGKRLLTLCYSHSHSASASAADAHHILDNNNKQQQQLPSSSNCSFISTAKKSYSSNFRLKKQHAHSTMEPWLIQGTSLLGDQPQPDSDSDSDYLVDALLLLQKSMLEKQWNLNLNLHPNSPIPKHKIQVTCSGTTARRRRLDSRRKLQKIHSHINNNNTTTSKQGYYVKGFVGEQLLTHAQVVHLSHKIKAGLFLEDRRSRYFTCFSDCVEYAVSFLTLRFLQIETKIGMRPFG